MQQVTISDFAAEKGQQEAAKLLGMRQPALNRALKLQRNIRVTLHADGTYTAEEVRPFPAKDSSGKGKRLTKTPSGG